MHVRDAPSLRILQHEVPVAYMIFDLLWVDGRLIIDRSYSERRQELEALGLSGARWQTPPASIGDGEAALATSRELDLEGIVAKRLDSRYESGRRSAAWRKIKHSLRQEFVVAGWTEGSGRRGGGLGALLLGYHDGDGALRYAGKVGTGFPDDELDRLDGLLAPLAREGNPFTGPGVHARRALRGAAVRSRGSLCRVDRRGPDPPARVPRSARRPRSLRRRQRGVAPATRDYFGDATAENVLPGPGISWFSTLVIVPHDLKFGIVNVPENFEAEPRSAMPLMVTLTGDAVVQ